MRSFARATAAALMLGGVAMPAWAQQADEQDGAAAAEEADENSKDVIVTGNRAPKAVDKIAGEFPDVEFECIAREGELDPDISGDVLLTSAIGAPTLEQALDRHVFEDAGEAAGEMTVEPVIQDAPRRCCVRAERSGDLVLPANCRRGIFRRRS